MVYSIKKEEKKCIIFICKFFVGSFFFACKQATRVIDKDFIGKVDKIEIKILKI